MLCCSNSLKVDQGLITEMMNPSVTSLNPEVDSLVLIFGKDKDISGMLKILLELWHYRVKLIEEWEELGKSCQEEKPILILVDLCLPFEENLQNLRRMREKAGISQIPVAALSGYSPPSFRRMAMNFGVNEYLVKPLDFDQLEDCLKIYASGAM